MRIRYKKERTPSNIRTHDGTIKHAYLDNNNYGVKGLSCLFALPEFDIIDGFSTDYMHGVFLGALKRLLSLWTGKLKSTKFKPLNKKKQEILNNRLTSIKPYSRISYLPRSLEEHATFRAIEYKYLLFFYLKYALRGLLDLRYINHFELLSASIYTLSKSEVLESELNLSNQMLNDFCDMFEEYYGVSSVTMNIHLLRHYGHIVKKTGPLWCHSLFGFETNMGVLTRYCSGGVGVLEQIANKYIIAKSICDKPSRDQPLKFTINLKSSSEHDSLLIQHGLSGVDGHIAKSTQITKRRILFKSIASRPTKRVDYFLMMNDETIGTAQFYVIKDSRIFVLLEVYKIVKVSYHLKEVEPTQKFMIFPFDFIKEKLLFLTFDTFNIVAKEPNRYEKT